MWDNILRPFHTRAPCSHHIIHTLSALFTTRVHTSITLFTLVFTLSFHTLATANLFGVALGHPRLALTCIFCTCKWSHARLSGHITCFCGRSDTLVLPPMSSTSVSHLHPHVAQLAHELGFLDPTAQHSGGSPVQPTRTVNFGTLEAISRADVRKGAPNAFSVPEQCSLSQLL